MEIVLKRIAKKGTYTIGRLYLLTDASVKRISLPGKKKDDKSTLVYHGAYMAQSVGYQAEARGSGCPLWPQEWQEGT